MNDVQQYNVFLVDNHPIVRFAYKKLLEPAPYLTVVGEAASAEDALETIPQTNTDLAIVGVLLENMDGLELTRKLKTLQPDVKVLVISMYSASVYAPRALKAGAQGYLSKDKADVLITEAIDQILAGETFLANAPAKKE